MSNLTEKRISFDTAMARMEGIFDGDEVKGSPDFEETGDAYLLALEDYRPEPAPLAGSEKIILMLCSI
jgi:hypothetical protein